MNEHHGIILRQADDGPNPPDLLRQIAKDIRGLLPTAFNGASDFVKGKGQQQLALAQEIMASVYEKIAHIEIERQHLIEEREEALRRVEREKERDQHAHEERLRELEIQNLREKREAFKEVADRIESLQKLGIEIDVSVIKKAISDML